MSSKKHTVSTATASAPAPSLQAPSFLSTSYMPLACIFLLAFLLYGNTISHRYALDDSIVITDNKYTKEGIKGLGKIFSTDAFEGFFGKKKNLVEGGRYRPLSIATFALEWEIAPNRPSFSHFVNILLYGLVGILLFVLLRMWFPENDPTKWWLGIPFWITLLFMAHPIHTEVVANIKGRDEIMALLFLLGAMVACFKFIDGKQWIWLVVSSVAFFLALLSKETPLPFVLILPLAIVFFRKTSLTNVALASAPIWIATAGYLAIRFSVLGFQQVATEQGTEILNDPFLFATTAQRTATVVETWGMYLIKLFVPLQLSHDYYHNQIPITTFGNPIVIASLLTNALLLSLGIYLMVRRNPIGFGILFYFISFSITSNLIISIGTTMGERFVFVPSIGFLIAAVLGIQALGKRFKWTELRLFYIVAIAIGLPFAISTVARNPVWKDNFTLFTNDAKVSPNSAKVRTAAGGVLIEESAKTETSPGEKTKLLQEAIENLNAAVKIYPEHGTAWMLLGNAYHELGDLAGSLQAYQKAIQYRPLLIDAYKNAAITARKLKRYAVAAAYAKAELDKRKALEIPEDAKYWFDRGQIFEEWGTQADSALWCYGIAVQFDPKMAQAFGQMGRVYGMQLNNFDKAIEMGEKAVSLDPKLDWVYENIGIAHAMKQEFDQAISAFQRGLGVAPNSGKLYLNLALTYRNKGDQANADAAFAKAFELDPSLKR